MNIFEKLYEMTAISGFAASPGSLLMLLIGGVLLYLGIAKNFEPLLLIPIGFGVLWANVPGAGMNVLQASEHPEITHMSIVEIAKEHGIINMLYYSLIKTGLLPPLIFMGVGALTDFGPMLRNLRLAFFGGAAQIGIFTVLIAAVAIGFTPKEAGALAIIGGADGPTAIYTTILLAPELLGPIAIAAYSYMALVPVIIPLIANLTMNKKDFKINMKQQDKRFPSREIKNLRAVKIMFPIMLFILVGVLVPTSVPLLGALLFGNLVKEIGNATSRLSDAASSIIMNSATVFLGLCIGATMDAHSFLQTKTLLILLGGFVAFSLSVAGGIYAAKIYNVFSKKKINPLCGATGLSAVPMASRVANDLALKHDSQNHILQYAMASNIAGVIGSAVAAGVLISFLN
ncbi:sodium ion-translocating decarboxylase subunit beta [Limibacter armeniacum]|uniref:sodium ion-translocating decarboxylase subunit beta n=1 Tax=Limibacter armeniacum TaxID=466084 RepID=UPI002FE6AF91